MSARADNGARRPAQQLPTGELRAHPMTALVPVMAGEQFRAFKADIAKRGVLSALEINAAGEILDGRARHRAASELALDQVPVRVVSPADEVEHILLCALQRRQLSASQRAALAVDLNQYRQLQDEARARRLGNLASASEPGAAEVAGLPPRGKTREIAAGWAGVSARTIQDAATVKAHDPALFEQVKAGRIAADQAANRVRRLLRDSAIPEPPPLPEGPFQLVYADPPWQLGNPDGPNAPERHYPTMTLTEIAALEPPAADDAILLLWAVNCLLPQALEVVRAWAFEYKTNLVWVKPSIGPGNWARNRHELLLLTTRGHPPPADPDLRPDSVIEADRRRHSQKPDEVYGLIETAWPHLSKLELLARTPRPGWAAWGNQLGDCPDSVLEAPRGRHSEKPQRFYELLERAYPQATKLELFARAARPGWAAWGNEVERR